MPPWAAAVCESRRAGPPRLGARLFAVAQKVRPGTAVADIGCDHGKLAVWLALREQNPLVVAVDNRALPLARAKALVRRHGCEHTVDCRLGNGLEPLAEGEVQDIVIAGVSGDTVAGILSFCGWIRTAAVRLILAPVTRHPQLRRFLCEQGFALKEEVPVMDTHRCYTVITAGYTGRAYAPAPLFCQLGLIPKTGGEAACAYIGARLEYLRKAAEAPMDKAERTAHTILMHEVEACLR